LLQRICAIRGGNRRQALSVACHMRCIDLLTSTPESWKPRRTADRHGYPIENIGREQKYSTIYNVIITIEQLRKGIFPYTLRIAYLQVWS